MGLLDRMRGTGSQMVPFASAGWDPCPRFACPIDHSFKKDYGGNYATVASGAPQQIANHLQSVIEWAAYHQIARDRFSYPTAPAKKVLIYAWNEFDEGGWLCPTLASDHLSPNLERHQAIKALLHP